MLRQSARCRATMDFPAPVTEDMRVTVLAGIISSTSQPIGAERAAVNLVTSVQSIFGGGNVLGIGIATSTDQKKLIALVKYAITHSGGIGQ